MKPSVRDQLQRYTDRLSELDFLLSRPDIMADMGQFMALSREHAEVAAVADRYARWRQRQSDLAAAEDLLQDPDMAEAKYVLRSERVPKAAPAACSGG